MLLELWLFFLVWLTVICIWFLILIDHLCIVPVLPISNLLLVNHFRQILSIIIRCSYVLFLTLSLLFQHLFLIALLH